VGASKGIDRQAADLTGVESERWIGSSREKTRNLGQGLAIEPCDVESTVSPVFKSKEGLDSRLLPPSIRDSDSQGPLWPHADMALAVSPDPNAVHLNEVRS
jgi:hypothetical protein